MQNSCDDTAAAVLDGDGNVLSNVVSSQWELNAKWKGAVVCDACSWTASVIQPSSRMIAGIVPALAARAHADNLPHVIAAAIEQR